jgi:hypothetical protein
MNCLVNYSASSSFSEFSPHFTFYRQRCVGKALIAFHGSTCHPWMPLSLNPPINRPDMASPMSQPLLCCPRDSAPPSAPSSLPVVCSLSVERVRVTPFVHPLCHHFGTFSKARGADATVAGRVAGSTAWSRDNPVCQDLSPFVSVSTRLSLYYRVYPAKSGFTTRQRIFDRCQRDRFALKRPTRGRSEAGI